MRFSGIEQTGAMYINLGCKVSASKEKELVYILHCYFALNILFTILCASAQLFGLVAIQINKECLR